MKRTAKTYVTTILLTLALQSGIPNVAIAQQNNKTLNVASYNLRMDTPKDGENAWPYRRETVKGLIRFHDFDIIGTQEGFKHMLDDISQLSEYSYIGVGREDGYEMGEHSAIFYKKDLFNLLDKGDFWLSETPEQPGKGWDATCCNRICSWGKFRDNRDNKEFFVFNVHYDHQGKIARRESSKLLLERIRLICDAQATIIVTGDFNALPAEEPIKIIASDSLLRDSYSQSLQPRYGTEGTHNSFRIDSEMKGRIDYIWVTSNIQVYKYAVLNDMPYAKFPSDHFPVMTQISF